MANATKPMPQRVRDKIAAHHLTNRLQAHVMGEIDLTATQVQAAKILLAKVVPDLKQVEHTGESAIQKITVVIK